MQPDEADKIRARIHAEGLSKSKEYLAMGIYGKNGAVYDFAAHIIQEMENEIFLQRENEITAAAIEANRLAAEANSIAQTQVKIASRSARYAMWAAVIAVVAAIVAVAK